MNKIVAFLAGFVMLLTVMLVNPAPAAAAPYCGITWGSTAKVQAPASPPDDFIYNVRAGRNDCYDRLVVDLGAAANYKGYRVEYGPVYQDGSGRQVPVRGEDISIIVDSVNYDHTGGLTYSVPNMNELVNVSGYSTFRQVAWAGAFEGQSTIALGVRAKLPMRAFVLTGPNNTAKLVVDVAHRW